MPGSISSHVDLDTTASHSTEGSLVTGALPTLRLLYCGTRGVLREDPIVLAPGVTWLGRDVDSRSDPRICLSADRRASRCHASLVRSAQGVLLRDEHSKNGTYRNGMRVAETTLTDGDVLRIGDSFFVYRVLPGSALPHEQTTLSSMIGVSPAIQALRQKISLLATQRATVLLQGESGTGKEVAARALHDLSRRSGALVAVNCSALPRDLAESLLFGHTASAFSGAQRAEPGFFRAADRGTLLLDEIGDLPLSLQPKLLRALEDRAVTPVGSTAPCRIDVRILAATHRDLVRAVQLREFRGDLYARLAEIPVSLPPLRERREDILPLFLHALETPRLSLTARLVAALLVHPFPFNVRELFKLAAQLQVETPAGQPLDLGPIADRLQAPRASDPTAGSPASMSDPVQSAAEGTGSLPARGPVPTREELAALLVQHRGNVSRIARETGRSRRQIDRWLESLDLDSTAFRP